MFFQEQCKVQCKGLSHRSLLKFLRRAFTHELRANSNRNLSTPLGTSVLSIRPRSFLVNCKSILVICKLTIVQRNIYSVMPKCFTKIVMLKFFCQNITTAISRPNWARVSQPLDHVVFSSIVKAFQSIVSCLLPIAEAYLIVNVNYKVIVK